MKRFESTQMVLFRKLYFVNKIIVMYMFSRLSTKCHYFLPLANRSINFHKWVTMTK